MFRLAIDSVMATESLAPLVRDFHAIADSTALRIDEEALTGTWESLLDMRSDLVIAVGPGPVGGGYVAHEAARVGFWFCVAPFHPLAKAREPLSEAQIRQHRAVVVADSAQRLPLRTTGLLTGQRTLVVPNMRTKLRYQLEGLGVGFLPVMCASAAVDAGTLVKKRVRTEREPEVVSVAWAAAARGNALAWWSERVMSAIEGILDSSRRLYAGMSTRG